VVYTRFRRFHNLARLFSKSSAVKFQQYEGRIGSHEFWLAAILQFLSGAVAKQLDNNVAA
jgi:hypothetical protein